VSYWRLRDEQTENRLGRQKMAISYMEILTTCKRCGKHYSPRREFKKCPHNFRDKFNRQVCGQGKE